MARKNPIEVQNYLNGVDYPCSRDDLVQAAKNNKAPDEVVEQIRGLPEQTYNQPPDVTKAVVRQ